MKKIRLLAALCLMLLILSACCSPADSATDAESAASAASTEAAAETPESSTQAPIVSDASSGTGFSLEAPEGFTASVVQDAFTFLVSPDAPTDTSSITVEVLARDESALQRTEDEFKTLITGGAVPEENQSPDAPQGSKTYSLILMQQVEVDGWPALLCEYDMAFTGFSSHILRYEVVSGSANYVFTFTDTTEDHHWQDAFFRSAETIHLTHGADGIAADYSGLTRYDLGGGLSIFAEDGMQPHKAEGFTACIGSRNAVILLMADNKQANNLTELDALGYADVLRQNNDLDEFQTNPYGDLYTHFYSTDETGAEYYNMLCIAETEEDFLVLQFACTRENQSLYAKQFALWASSLTQAN